MSCKEIINTARFLSILFFLHFAVFGQTKVTTPKLTLDSSNFRHNTNIIHLGLDEGLPQSEVTDLYLTKTGFLWVSTQNGVARYDGRSFTNFNSYDFPHIKSSRTRGIFRIRKNQPRIVFENWRAVELDSLGFELNVVSDIDRKKYSYRKRSVFITQRGQTYKPNIVAIDTGTYYHFDLQQGDTWFETKSVKHKVNFRSERHLYEGTFVLNKKMYYLTKTGYLIRFNGTEVDTLNAKNTSRSENASTFLKDAQVIWKMGYKSTYLISNGILYRVSSTKNGNILIKSLASGLPNYKYHSIVYAPQFDCYFLGTFQNGLIRLNFSRIEETRLLGACEDDFFNYAIVSIGSDSIANTAGCVFSNHQVYCNGIPDFPKLALFSLYYDKNQKLIYGTDDESLVTTKFDKLSSTVQYYEPPESLGGRIRTIAGVSDYVLLTTNKTGIIKFQDGVFTPVCLLNRTSTSKNFYSHLEVVSDSTYLLTHHDGLTQINLSSDRVTEYYFPNSPSFNYAKMLGDTIWAASNIDGIHLKLPNQPFRRLHLPEYAQIGSAHSLYFYKNLVIVSTNTGLLGFKRSELVQRLKDPTSHVNGYVFSEYDGLTFYEFNGNAQPCVIEMEDGFVAYPTLTGISKVQLDPKTILNAKHNDIYLSKTVVNDSIDLDLDLMQIPADYVNLTFHFLRSKLAHSSESTVKYRIPNLSSRWSVLNPEEIIKINRIPSGKYTIEFQNNPLYSKQGKKLKRVSFQILPHFYETAQFYVLSIAFIIIIFIIFLGASNQRAINKQRKLNEKIDLSTVDLRNKTIILEKNLLSVNEAQNEMIAANELRNKMIAVFSHDVRGPLRFFKELIVGASELSHKNGYRKVHEDLSKLGRIAGDSYEMANDILGWIKTKLSTAVIDHQKTNISEFIISTLDERKRLNVYRKLEIKESVEEGLEVDISQGDLTLTIIPIIHNFFIRTKTKITVSLVKKKYGLRLIIVDDRYTAFPASKKASEKAKLSELMARTSLGTKQDNLLSKIKDNIISMNKIQIQTKNTRTGRITLIRFYKISQTS